MTTTETAPAPKSGFLGWYRRFYLLVNVPVLLLLTELLLLKFDVVHRLPLRDPDDLQLAEHRMATPPADRPTIILLGNSALREGLDQRVIEHTLGDAGIASAVYNFGLSAARLGDQRAQAARLAERGVKPKAIVLGVNLFLIDDQVNSDTVYPWNQRCSPYLYFHRSRFRQALFRGARYAVSSRKRRKELDQRWTEGAQFRFDRLATPKETAGFLATLIGEFGTRPPASYPLIADIRGFVAEQLARGVQVYIVLLPMNPSGMAKLTTYPALMATLRAAVPVERTLDLADALPAELFYDMGHVNAAGRAQLSARVGTWLSTKPELR